MIIISRSWHHNRLVMILGMSSKLQGMVIDISRVLMFMGLAGNRRCEQILGDKMAILIPASPYWLDIGW